AELRRGSYARPLILGQGRLLCEVRLQHLRACYPASTPCPVCNRLPSSPVWLVWLRAAQFLLRRIAPSATESRRACNGHQAGLARVPRLCEILQLRREAGLSTSAPSQDRNARLHPEG